MTCTTIEQAGHSVHGSALYPSRFKQPTHCPDSNQQPTHLLPFVFPIWQQSCIEIHQHYYTVTCSFCTSVRRNNSPYHWVTLVSYQYCGDKSMHGITVFVLQATAHSVLWSWMHKAVLYVKNCSTVRNLIWDVVCGCSCYFLHRPRSCNIFYALWYKVKGRLVSIESLTFIGCALSLALVWYQPCPQLWRF